MMQEPTHEFWGEVLAGIVIPPYGLWLLAMWFGRKFIEPRL